MTQKGLTPILIVLILAALIGGYLVYQQQAKPTSSPQPNKVTQPSPTPSGTLINGSIAWDIPPGTLPETEEQQLKEATSRLNDQQNEDTYLSVTDVLIEGNYAVLAMQIKNRATGAVVPTGGLEFLAYKEGNGWQITKPDDPNFCEILKKAPDSITSKDYYIGCQ